MILATIFITAINLAAVAFFIRRGWVNRPRQVSGQVIPFPKRENVIEMRRYRRG